LFGLIPLVATAIAASQIYNMLMDYKGQRQQLRLNGIAASAASVIAMAGTEVQNFTYRF